MRHKTEDLMPLVGESHWQAYETKFDRISSGRRTFNWAAFLFGAPWFLYRKMYMVFAVYLAAYLAAVFTLNKALEHVGISETAQQVLSAGGLLFICVVTGLIADNIYVRHLDRLCDRYKGSRQIERGGTNPAAAAIYVFAYIFLCILFIATGNGILAD